MSVPPTGVFLVLSVVCELPASGLTGSQPNANIFDLDVGGGHFSAWQPLLSGYSLSRFLDDWGYSFGVCGHVFSLWFPPSDDSQEGSI